MPGRLAGSRRRPPASQVPSGHERARGDSAHLEQNALKGRTFHLGGGDCFRHGWRPDLKNDLPLSIDDADMRLFHRDVQSGKIVQRFDLKPRRLAADTAYGTGKFLGWLVKEKKIIPHIPVWEKSDRQDGIFSRSDFRWDRKRGPTSAPTGNCLRPAGPPLSLSFWASPSAAASASCSR